MKAYMVEEMVLNMEVQVEMENYRFYRIEYGGVNEDSRMTGVIWLPPEIDEDEILDILNRNEE